MKRPSSARALLLAACLAAGAPCVRAADAAPPKLVQAPHYGDTLFLFFQDKWFDAITGLMVSQQFTRVAPHDDEAEVLRGGMLLSYGLHREAGEVFARLIERNAAPPVRDRAWYFLAKLRYQRGLLADAEQALARVEHPLVANLEDDRQLLAAQLKMAREDYRGAIGVLEGIQTSATAGLFARFNLGVALVRSGDVARGSALLDELGQTRKLGSEELKVLRDRANVALGFAALNDQRPEDARQALQRVRLQGPQSNKALLGFGWAAATLKAPKEALVPWMELAGRDSADAAVLEARLAVPYAYAEIGALGRALDGYNDAIALYESEARRLDESITAIRGGALVGSLLDINPAAGMSAFGAIRELPQMPHAGHLSQILAGHEFQEAFKNLRDLLFLTHNLQDWQQRLAAFDDMVANRRQAYAERLPRVLAAAGEAGLPARRRQLEGLTAELTRAEDGHDGAAFADPRQRDLLQRLQSVQATLAAQPDAEAAERARRVAGALTWELQQQYTERAWVARKGLAAAGQALASAEGHQRALEQAQKDEPARFEAFARRIAALRAEVTAALPRVATLTAQQHAELQSLAVAELQRQKERLDVYSGQARLAVAQLMDKAQVAGRSDDDAKR